MLLYLVEKKGRERLTQIFKKYSEKGLSDDEARSICEDEGLMDLVTVNRSFEEDKKIEEKYGRSLEKLFTEDNKKGARDLAKALNSTYRKNVKLLRHGQSDWEETCTQLICVVSEFIEEKGLPEVIANFVCSEEDFLWLIA